MNAVVIARRVGSPTPLILLLTLVVRADALAGDLPAPAEVRPRPSGMPGSSSGMAGSAAMGSPPWP